MAHTLEIPARQPSFTEKLYRLHTLTKVKLLEKNSSLNTYLLVAGSKTGIQTYVTQEAWNAFYGLAATMFMLSYDQFL
jgi:hypothetical protein